MEQPSPNPPAIAQLDFSFLRLHFLSRRLRVRPRRPRTAGAASPVCMMPACCAPTSLQQNSQFFLPIFFAENLQLGLAINRLVTFRSAKC